MSKSDIARDVGKNLQTLAKDSLIDATASAIEGGDVKAALSNNLKSARKEIAKTIKRSGRVKSVSKRKQQKPTKKRGKRRKYNFIEDDAF